MKKIFILDVSGYLYRSYFAIRQMTNEQGESTNALFGFIRSFLKLVKDFSPEHCVAVFDGPENTKTRRQIYPEYKTHRKKTPDDLIYQMKWAREFCDLMRIPYLSVAEVEADDTMGSVAKWAEKMGSEVFLCTSDKDMCQLVSKQVHILHTNKENFVLDEEGVKSKYGVYPDRIVDYLAIMGDASDNVPGIPGFGEKTAISLLEKCGSLEQLLAHPDGVVKGKKLDTLRENEELAKLSKQLVTLDCSVAFPKEEEFFRLKPPEVASLKQFYQSKNFHSFVRELDRDSEEEEKSNYHLVDDEKTLQALIDFLLQQKEVCFDTETTDISPIRAELVGVGFGVKPGQAWYVPTNGQLGLEKVIAAIRPLFASDTVRFYAHNAKYDLLVLGNYGIAIRSLCFDTILASYLLKSNQRNHSLDYLTLEYFGKTKTSISALIGKGKEEKTMREVPISSVVSYCCEDVDYCCRLKGILEKELQERGLDTLLQKVELPLLYVLAKMERAGIYVDTAALAELSQKLSREIEKNRTKITLLAGEDFNLNSPKQLSEILFVKLGITPPKKTSTGFSTDASVLEGLQGEYPIASALLEYRSLEKLRSTYADALSKQVFSKTGRVHCTFNQSVAATGRLSSQDPNLQNIPVRTEMGRQIRRAFRPEKEGWSFLSADYSQIELRLLAHFSGDPQLLKAFSEGKDVHAHTASMVFEVPLSEVTKQQRGHAKAVNFGIIYGQQAFGLARQLGVDRETAQRFIDAYFLRYQRVKEYLEECKERARSEGKAVTLLGRERLIHEMTNSNIHLRQAAERLAINTPLQGTAADLIKCAMIAIDSALKKEALHCFTVLQIHDELILELPDYELDRVKPLVREIMEKEIVLQVPLVVDISVGKNWMEC